MGDTVASHVNPDRVMLAENTRKEVREALQSGSLKASIIPIGSIEQHNEHLALNTDIAMSTFISQQVALRLYPQVLVAPPCQVGYSPYHMARKGTLTLRKETLRAYIYDVAESLRAHGIRCVLVVNGHGGNGGILRGVFADWRHQLGITMDEASYWDQSTDADREGILQGYRDLRDGKLDTVARQTALNHAAEDETSLMMAAYPQRVRSFTMEEYDAADLDYANDLSPEVENYLRPFGREGWPKGGNNPENPRDRARQENAMLATAEKGEALLAIHVRNVAGKMQRMIDVTEQGLPWPPAE